MVNCRSTKTLLNASEKLSLDDGVENIDEKNFKSLVGGLICLTHTRLDIVFSVSLISRFIYNPNKHHLEAAKRIIRYVWGTWNFGIKYMKSESNNLVAYTDNDWTSCVDGRKSTTWFICSLGLEAISWSLKKNQSIALSSTEAEYIVDTTTTCQTVWLRWILEELKQKHVKPTVILFNNKSTISMFKNLVWQGRTKCIETRYHFIRELVTTGEVKLEYCNINM